MARHRLRRLAIASLLAILGSLVGCGNLASLGIGFTLDPLGIEIRIRTDLDVPAWTITPTTQPATTRPATIPATLPSELPIVITGPIGP